MVENVSKRAGGIVRRSKSSNPHYHYISVLLSLWQEQVTHVCPQGFHPSLAESLNDVHCGVDSITAARCFGTQLGVEEVIWQVSETKTAQAEGWQTRLTLHVNNNKSGASRVDLHGLSCSMARDCVSLVDRLPIWPRQVPKTRCSLYPAVDVSVPTSRRLYSGDRVLTSYSSSREWTHSSPNHRLLPWL